MRKYFLLLPLLFISINTFASLSFSGCDLKGLTTTVGLIGNKYYTGINCFGLVNSGSYTEFNWFQWGTITGSNTVITGFRTNQLYFGNCSISSVSASRFTGVNCIGNLQLITGSIGATGATGVTGSVGPTGNVVFTLSGYNLTTLSGGVSVTSGDSTIVNNVFDYDKLLKVVSYGGALALSVIFILFIVTGTFRSILLSLIRLFSKKKKQGE